MSDAILSPAENDVLSGYWKALQSLTALSPEIKYGHLKAPPSLVIVTSVSAKGTWEALKPVLEAQSVAYQLVREARNHMSLTLRVVDRDADVKHFWNEVTLSPYPQI